MSTNVPKNDFAWLFEVSTLSIFYLVLLLLLWVNMNTEVTTLGGGKNCNSF